jgi:NitT/TauT family transport system substrate-binding protein
MRRQIRVQTVLALAVVLAIAAGLVVDGVKSVSASSGNAGLKSVTVATITGSSSSAALFLAMEEGYFRDVGIDLKLQEFKAGAEMIPPVSTGQIDAGLGGLSAGLFNAINDGLPIKLVADGAMSVDPGYVGLLVRKKLVDSGRFRSLRDLKGMTVAIPAAGSSPQVQLDAFLRKAGLTLRDVQVEQVGFADQIVALRNGAIDAGITLEPSMSTGVSQGVATRVAGSQTVLPGQHQAAVFFGPTLLRDDRELGNRFVAAYLRGVRAYLSGLKDGRVADTPAGQRIAEVLAKHTAIKDPKRYMGMALQGVLADGQIPDAAVQRDVDFWTRQGLIRKRTDVPATFDRAFATAAAKAGAGGGDPQKTGGPTAAVPTEQTEDDR